jgi:hypothetical protein
MPMQVDTREAFANLARSGATDQTSLRARNGGWMRERLRPASLRSWGRVLFWVCDGVRTLHQEAQGRYSALDGARRFTLRRYRQSTVYRSRRLEMVDRGRQVAAHQTAQIKIGR